MLIHRTAATPDTLQAFRRYGMLFRHFPLQFEGYTIYNILYTNL